MVKPGTNAFMFQFYGQPGDHKHLETYEFYPGIRITTDKRARGAFEALGRVMAAHKYVVRRGDTGAYNKRRIAGSRSWSNHSWGTAVDVNWNTNPYSSRLITDMPKAMVDDILRIRTGNGKTVFRWGGNYSRKKDAMHFEVMVTPADLATGIREPDSVVVPWGPAPGVTEGSGDVEMITQGSKGPYVAQVQRLINGVNHRSFEKKVFDKPVDQVEVDGIWGPKSQDALAHAMLRAAKVTLVDFAEDYELSTVTPAMVAHLYAAASQLGNM